MKNIGYTSLLFIVLLLAAACKKGNSSDDTPAGDPVVNSINPATGPYGTKVTIDGNHFAAAAGDNKVEFNGKAAVVTEAAVNKLVVTVPKGAGTGPVTVTVNGKKVTGPAFTYVYSATVSTLAGGTQGYADGTGTAAKFDSPNDLCTDANGNVYVSDRLNQRIRKITPAGVVTTLAGSTLGYTDGHGASAKFSMPRGIGIGNGGIYVADETNHRIRKVTLDGWVTTIAGNGVVGFKDTIVKEARFYHPYDVCVSKSGVIFVADEANHRIRKIRNGKVSTIAGKYEGFADGAEADAKFSFPMGINISGDGKALYVADGQDNGIRKIVLKNVITGVLAAEDTVTFIPDAKYFVSTVMKANGGDQDGPLNTAEIGLVYNLSVDTAGNIFLADGGNAKVSVITTSAQLMTIAGSQPFGYADGSAATAKFWMSGATTVDKQGNIYVADTYNHAIRKITLE
jgi:sugar lactone lactonase YvrE